MKQNIFKIVGLILLFVSSISFTSCEPEDISASSDWNGTWKMNESIVFPSKSLPTGTIKVDHDDETKIIMSGDLFGLQPSFEVEASVVTTTASFSTTVGAYKMSGTAKLLSEKTIDFSFTITYNDNPKTYKRTATKVN